ncbi:MAG: oligosaccharide flippase family protein, partial [Sphingobium sp.]
AAIQLGLTVALAHFLTPADFGLVAMLLPIALFLLLVGDFGLTAAIVSRAADPAQAGAAATLCMGFGTAVPALMLVLHGAGALAFMRPQAADLLVAFGLVTALAMAAVVPRALLESRLLYGRIAGIETAANMLGAVVAIGSAALGAGAWSFALYHLVMQAGRAAGLGLAARDHLELNLDWRRAQPLLRLGGWIAAFNIVNFLMRNLDRYIVAAWLGTDALGLYALAYQVMLLPLMAVTWPVSAVLVATLGRLRDRPDAQREAFLATLTLAGCITLPATTFVALFSDLIFAALLPARWALAAHATGVMAIAGGLQSITAFTGVLFLVQGRVKAQFWFGAGATALTLGTLLVCATFAPVLPALVLAYAILTALLNLFYLRMMARLLQTDVRRIVARIAPAVALSIAAGALALATDALIAHWSPGARLIGDMLVFGTVIGAGLLARRATLVRLVAILQGAGQAARPAPTAA